QELIGTFNSILKISELEANTSFRHFEYCDARQLIETLVDLYEPYAMEKDITLTSQLTDPFIIKGEKNLLTQAFSNLIDNALKFTPKGGTVSIWRDMEATSPTIIIADS